MTEQNERKDLPEMLTTKQVAKYLGVTTGRVRHMIRDERLIAEKRGRDWFVTRESVLAIKDRKPGRPKSPESN